MRMLALAATALTLLSTAPSFAQTEAARGQWGSPAVTKQQAVDRQFAEQQGRDDRDRDRDRNDRDRYDRNDRDRDDRMNSNGRDDWRWSKGDRLPQQYRERDYMVRDYRRYNLRTPPRGYHWMRAQNRYVLVSKNNYRISEIVIINNFRPGNREAMWRNRYSRSYVLDDDSFYRDCRNGPDPAGVIVGALAGGLLGRTVAGRGDRNEGTVIGVIAGGAIGAALTNKVECEDRSYMYRSYINGFNNGRPNSNYTWENPRNKHRGDMRVMDYYNDEDDFHCAVYVNTIYIDGRREEARGRACQQPDGNWAIID